MPNFSDSDFELKYSQLDSSMVSPFKDASLKGSELTNVELNSTRFWMSFTRASFLAGPNVTGRVGIASVEL